MQAVIKAVMMFNWFDLNFSFTLQSCIRMYTNDLNMHYSYKDTESEKGETLVNIESM